MRDRSFTQLRGCYFYPGQVVARASYDKPQGIQRSNHVVGRSILNLTGKPLVFDVNDPHMSPESVAVMHRMMILWYLTMAVGIRRAFKSGMTQGDMYLLS